jgi:hypothetical protein
MSPCGAWALIISGRRTCRGQAGEKTLLELLIPSFTTFYTRAGEE